MAEQKESVTMDALLKSIDSELKSGTDMRLCEMLDVMKTYGNAGCSILAQKIELSIARLDQGDKTVDSVSVEFNADDRVDDIFLQLVSALQCR